MSRNSYVLSGPEENHAVPEVSVGQYIFNKLKNRHPNDIVTVDVVTKKTLTCGRALEDSITFTKILKSFGIQKGDVIALISENTINYCIPIFASLYMGVIVNPINPTYTAGEIKHALHISKAKLIICSGKVLENILQIKKEFEFIKTIIVTDVGFEENSHIESYEKLLRMTTADLENYKPETFNPYEQGALICLSSGTTGLSKGVLISHENLRTAFKYFPDSSYVNVTAKDTTVLFLPLFHIYGLLIQIVAFTTGMKVMLMDKFVPDLFLEAIQNYKATKLFVVPPILLFLVKTSVANTFDISSLKDIICAAAPLSKELQDEAAERLRNVSVRQLYGLTETSGACTLEKVGTKMSGTIGSLIPGALAKVWDPQTKEIVGPLKMGELCVKGSMVMKCYYGNETATKDSMDEDGFFHTGDIGYYDEDGLLYTIDRLKEVIKYKGYQVPPAELEALILTHPEVKDCAVLGIPNERAGEVPLAYVVLQDGAKTTEQELVDFVAGRISINKRLYGGVQFISEIPKSQTGKILRKKLKELYNSTQFL